MSYEDLKGHAQTIKELAISKTIDQGIQASSGAAAYGGVPPIGFLEDQAKMMFSGTESIFDEWLGLPDPSHFSSGLSTLQGAMSALGAESYLTNDLAQQYAGGSGTSMNISAIEPTGAFMQGWQSGTALSYANFAGVFGPVAANLSMAMNVLHGAYDAERALWEEARKNVDGLAEATITALEKCTDKRPKDVQMALTVLGAVAGVVAVPFTAGGSLAASYTFATIGAATALGGAFAPEETESDSPITGDVPWEIVDSLVHNLTTLNEKICAAEDKIHQALTDTAGDFGAALGLPSGQSPVKMPRPSVADDPSLGRHG
ncbi:hypothetical protein BH11ACT8_BH11ACT8_21410 [soil metagenome]